MGSFTLQSLYNYSLKSSFEGYKCMKIIHTCLPSFFVILSSPEITVRRHIEFYAGGLIFSSLPQYFDVQEPLLLCPPSR